MIKAIWENYNTPATSEKYFNNMRDALNWLGSMPFTDGPNGPLTKVVVVEEGVEYGPWEAAERHDLKPLVLKRPWEMNGRKIFAGVK